MCARAGPHSGEQQRSGANDVMLLLNPKQPVLKCCTYMFTVLMFLVEFNNCYADYWILYLAI